MRGHIDLGLWPLTCLIPKTLAAAGHDKVRPQRLLRLGTLISPISLSVAPTVRLRHPEDKARKRIKGAHFFL